jgi:transposase
MNKSRLSIEKQKGLIEHFVGGTTARVASEIVGVNPKTGILYYHRLRQIIYEFITPKDFSGELELDESYFVGIGKGKRSRGAAGKTPVLVFSNAEGKYILRWFPIQKPILCCLL